MMELLSFLIFVVFGYWLYRKIVPTYKIMTSLVVDRANQLLAEGVSTVYLLQPQQRNVIRGNGPWGGQLAPMLNFAIAYIKDDKLILESAAWQKLFTWGSWTRHEVPEPNPQKRSIRLGNYTFLVLSTHPNEFSKIIWSADFPPPEIAVQYRDQLYDAIASLYSNR